ncbi:hypothetical protein PoB_003254100 [Plakobranchus ocellatus]|uniref:Suppressor APC domain-containing protein n=1 Tax=Plakobranchus ocellatus TaxID=259542 RepID=A0AAV4ACE1_9GAST|nr:hypothetical protein PoB_003254100 [Plakobranchus ocellatus]
MDTLPKQFLSSLRILFDILDENRTGLIRLQDIESRWSDDGVRGLPPGVVDGLRKVTPPNGLLSFDRFVAGLKLVLVKKRDSTDIRKPLASKENQFFSSQANEKVLQNQRFQTYHDPNKQNYEIRDYQSSNNKSAKDDYHASQHRLGERVAAAAKRFDQQRHHSDSHDGHTNMPSPINPTTGFHQATNRDGDVPMYRNSTESQQHQQQIKTGKSVAQFRGPLARDHDQPDRPPTLPPRLDRPLRVSLQQSRMRKSQSGPDLSSQPHSPPAVPPRQGNSQVLADLKNWQAAWPSGSQSSQPNLRMARRGGSASPTNRSPHHDDAIYANLDDLRAKTSRQPPVRASQKQLPQPQQPLQQTSTTGQAGPQRATVRRHGSGRRHTLSNGIDQNMLRRMKQLEEETSILHAGMAMLDSARDWYKKQLAAVADKQAMLGKVSYNDNSVEAHQERMNFQRARIAEVNQHLQTLIDSSEKGFPLHMNLAMSTGLRLGAAGGLQDTATAREVQSLREQNRKLQQEATQRRDQMSQLEREKASLVRDLFEARAKNRPTHDDTTFM